MKKDTERAIRDLEDEVRVLKTQNIDLHKRRFVNAHRAVSRSDFMTKGDFDDAIADIQKKTAEVIRRIGRGTSVGTGTGTGSPIPTTLPVPNHPMDFGYYRVDGVREGNFIEEVRGWTNLVYVGPFDYMFESPPTSPSDGIALLTAGIDRLADAGFSIMLDVERGNRLTKAAVLSAAAPHWDKVKYLILGDEISTTAAALDTEIQALKNNVTNLGLAQKPVGVTLTPNTTLSSDSVFASLLDFVNIEAYSPDPANHGTSQQNIDTIKSLVDRMVARIPAQKRLTLVMQAYNRNNSFSPVSPDLVDLQRATYLMVYQNTRVDAIVMFAWAFGNGGSQDLPELQGPHKEIWGAISGAPGSGSGATKCGQGRPCCGGLQNEEDCPRWCSGGDYEDQVKASISAYIAGAPSSVITPPETVLDAPTYMAGVVARINADYPTLEAKVDPGHDGKEIIVHLKGTTAFSEQYALWAGGGSDATIRRPPGFYRATCYPSRF
jgi:hypothetical protein